MLEFISSKVVGSLPLRAFTAHQTPTSRSCKGTSWSAVGFLEHQVSVTLAVYIPISFKTCAFPFCPALNLFFNILHCYIHCSFIWHCYRIVFTELPVTYFFNDIFCKNTAKMNILLFG
jgi:hypothetical protein